MCSSNGLALVHVHTVGVDGGSAQKNKKQKTKKKEDD